MPRTQNDTLKVPMNLEAERTILGGVLNDFRVLDECSELSAADFFLEQNRVLFEALLAMRDQHRGIDLVSLHDYLSSTNKLEQCGGAAYIASLLDSVPTKTDWRRLVSILREKAARRRLLYVARQIIECSTDESNDIENLLDLTSNQLADVSFSLLRKHTLVSYRDAAKSKITSFFNKPAPLLATGIPSLDSIIGGFMPGELVVITAMTGAGKSLFAAQIRATACSQNLHGLYASGEMYAEHLAGRELATSAGVPHRKMRMPWRYNDNERRAILASLNSMCERCRILDGELSMTRIRREARKLNIADGCNFVILDYDELIDAPGETEIEQQKNLAKEAKRLAVELHCPVILISQLRKGLSPEEAKKPSLDRIYGSGMKVKHASLVLYVQRRYVQDLIGDETEANIYVLKSRDTGIGRIEAVFNVKTLRFDEKPTLAETVQKASRSKRRSRREEEEEGEG